MFEMSTSFTGQTNTPPNTTKIFTDATYTEVTTAGWLNTQLISPNAINLLDVFDVRYGVTSSSSGSVARFSASSAAGVITLTALINPGNVIFPVVSGDIAVFSGTDGKIADSHISFTDTSLTKVASVATGGYAAGQIIVANDTTGSIRTGLGITAFQINSPSSATPSGATAINGGLTLPASSLTSGSAAGTTSFMTLNANAGADLCGHSATITPAGALGATSITSASRSELILNANAMTAGAVLAGHYIKINASSGVTGSTADYCGAYISGPQTGSLGSLFSFNGKAGDFIHIVDGGSMVTTPAGSTPGGTLKAILLNIGGTTYQWLVSTTLT